MQNHQCVFGVQDPYQSQIYVFFPAAGITSSSSLQFHVPPGRLSHTNTTMNADILRWLAVYFLSRLFQPAADVVTREFQLETLQRSSITCHFVQWEWDAEVHSPDVCPCRECVRMCVCCVRSIVLSIWNIRRSSSSKAMSPQKTAGKREKSSSTSSSPSSAPTVSLHHLWKWSHEYIKL